MRHEPDSLTSRQTKLIWLLNALNMPYIFLPSPCWKKYHKMSFSEAVADTASDATTSSNQCADLAASTLVMIRLMKGLDELTSVSQHA